MKSKQGRMEQRPSAAQRDEVRIGSWWKDAKELERRARARRRAVALAIATPYSTTKESESEREKEGPTSTSEHFPKVDVAKTNTLKFCIINTY